MNKVRCGWCGAIRMQGTDFVYHLQYEHSAFDLYDFVKDSEGHTIAILKEPPRPHEFFDDEDKKK